MLDNVVGVKETFDLENFKDNVGMHGKYVRLMRLFWTQKEHLTMGRSEEFRSLARSVESNSNI